MDGGLLIERSVGATNTTSSMTDQSSLEEGLPVMFSLLHPLDDISPIVCCYPSTGKIYPFIICVLCTHTRENLVGENFGEPYR